MSQTIYAFEHDGALKWARPTKFTGVGHAVALADLDNDGDVEIVVRNRIFDHDGNELAAFDSAAPVLLSTRGRARREILATYPSGHRLDMLSEVAGRRRVAELTSHARKQEFACTRTKTSLALEPDAAGGG